MCFLPQPYFEIKTNSIPYVSFSMHCNSEIMANLMLNILRSITVGPVLIIRNT